MRTFCPSTRSPLLPLLILPLIALPLQQLSARDYSLSKAAEERLATYLPRTFPKLTTRQPVHVVALGDSITNLVTLDEHDEDWLQSYPALFLEKLTAQFVYTGGLRLVKAKNKDRAKKSVPFAGPEITYHNLAQTGSTVLQGTLRATSLAFLNKPDLILVNFGVNDASFELPIDRYHAMLGGLIDQIKAQGADCIVLGSTLFIADPAEDSLGLVRPYAKVAQELAEARGVLFIDLGDPALFVSPMTASEPPSELLPRVIRQLAKNAHLFENGKSDGVHINLSAHGRLAHTLYQELLQPSPAPLSLSDAVVTQAADGSLSAQVTISNSSSRPISCHVAPLSFARSHSPTSEAIACEIPAGSSLPLTASYAPKTDGSAIAFPARPELLRLPFLVGTDERTTILTAKASLSPIAVSWDTGLTINVPGAINIKATISNPNSKPFAGQFTGEWKGQKSTGAVSLAPGGQQEITLTFTAPTSPQVSSTRGPLELSFDNGLRFARDLELSRNLGLQQWLPLQQESSYQPDATTHPNPNPNPNPNPGSPVVQFRVDADLNALFFSYDLRSLNLIDAEDQPAALLELQLDARSYGRRQKAGAVRQIKVTFPGSADGLGTIDKLGDGIFGNDYTAQLDPAGITAQLSTRANGNRRITIAIPRKYFYLHEYGRVPDRAIGNGNSQFGINTSLSLLNPDPKSEIPFPPERRFILVRPAISKYDAESLSALELANPGTGRWSARLF